MILFGHGLTGNRFLPSNAIASATNLAGFALLSPDVYNHGFGPGGSLTLTTENGALTLPAPGRGYPNPADGSFGPTGACVFPSSLGSRDCARQTAVDFMSLIRAIRSGLDVDGDGSPDLDGSRIYYLGQSFGAIYGTILNAVEASIRAATLNTGGGSVVDAVRLAADRSLLIAYLGSQRPPLPPNHPVLVFNGAFVFRDQEVMTVTPPFALDYQEVFERADWLGMPGDALAFDSPQE